MIPDGGHRDRRMSRCELQHCKGRQRRRDPERPELQHTPGHAPGTCDEEHIDGESHADGVHRVRGGNGQDGVLAYGVPSEQAGSPGARLECRFDGLRQDDAFSAVYQPVRPCTAAEQRLKMCGLAIVACVPRPVARLLNTAAKATQSQRLGHGPSGRGTASSSYPYWTSERRRSTQNAISGAFSRARVLAVLVIPEFSRNPGNGRLKAGPPTRHSRHSICGRDHNKFISLSPIAGSIRHVGRKSQTFRSLDGRLGGVRLALNWFNRNVVTADAHDPYQSVRPIERYGSGGGTGAASADHNTAQSLKTSDAAISQARTHASIAASPAWVAALVLLGTPGVRYPTGDLKGADFIQLYTLAHLAFEGEYPQSEIGPNARPTSGAGPGSATEDYLPVYPPQAALLFAPFRYLSDRAAVYVWVLILIAGYAAIVSSAWRSVRDVFPDRWFVPRPRPPFRPSGSLCSSDKQLSSPSRDSSSRGGR